MSGRGDDREAQYGEDGVQQRLTEYIGRVREVAEEAKKASQYPAAAEQPEDEPGALRVEFVPEPHRLNVGTPPSDDGYDSLRHILEMAVEQAAGGKGKERHATGQPFDEQPICQGGRRFGPTCLIYQAWKKCHETPVLLMMDNGKDRAVRELLGVINYAAAAILVIQEK